MLYIQLWRYDFLSEQARESWNRQLPQSAERGLILDRNQAVLVTNRLKPSLYVMPGQLTDVEELVDELHRLSQLPKEVISKEVTRKSSLNELKKTAKALTEEQLIGLQTKGFPGLYTTVSFQRAYPYGKMLAPVMGFVGADGQGLAGLEYQYDAVLTGTTGSLELYTDAKGKRVEGFADEWNDGKPGYQLQLTIDRTIQQILDAKLSEAMATHQAKQAIGIVMQPQTGELLALSSLPTYDPAKYQQEDPNVIYKNLPVTMTFEPGSTFKIITLSAALEEGLVDLEDDHFHDPGYRMVAGQRLRCWKREGHGSQTFMEVVENSCNPGFIEMGDRLGPEKLHHYITQFGFGSSTESGLSGEQKGLLFSPQQWGPVEQATTAFGQGIAVTPMQQVSAIAAAINGGYLMQPYLVAKTLDPLTNEVVAENFPTIKRRVISEQTSEQVRLALGEVVAHGSGNKAYRTYTSIGGKTGTAQKVENGVYKDGEYIVSFIGFAPVDAPKYLIYIAIDAPQGPSQFGGTIAAPIVGELFEAIAEDSKMIHIKERTWDEMPELKVPNLIGLSKDEIEEQLHEFKLIWHGDGQKILDQLPAPDEFAKPPYLIHLYTD